MCKSAKSHKNERGFESIRSVTAQRKIKMKRDLNRLDEKKYQEQKRWNEIWIHLNTKSTNNRDTEMSFWINSNS